MYVNSNITMNDTQTIFRIAAQRIADELDNRGFTTDYIDGTEGLVDKIADIIGETIRGDVNFTHAAEIEGRSGWDGDLQNQIT